MGQSAEAPYDFEVETVHYNMTLFAKWEEVLSNQHKITYDLNGAIQVEEWNEFVEHGALAAGPTMDPVYAGHLFQGWAYDSEGLVMFDFETALIESDLTLYAVWHVDFVVHALTNEFEDVNANWALDLVDGYVLQQYELFANTMLYSIENDLDLSEDRLEYGALLSRNNEQMTYYANQATRLVGDLSQTELNQTSILTFRLITEDLIGEASYFYRFYIRYETTILYSPVFELQTMVKVPTATAVGLDMVLSGGVYKLDNGTAQWRPSKLVGVMTGYSAQTDAGAVETGYFNLYNEGVRSIVTTDLETGKRVSARLRTRFPDPARHDHAFADANRRE
ncbi:MAG: InlB B-repeat-containing protein [Bacillus subtilis]|nr:InlB B-repeat-containing protein [Bacillus subtilis]